MGKNQNRLDPKNCNKKKCVSCIFGDTPIELTQERILEIYTYLTKFESSHICHTTNLTCYGALEYQAKLLHTWKIIEEPTVECFLKKAGEVLKLT